MLTKYLIKYSYNDEPDRIAYEEVISAKSEAEARSLLIKYKGNGKWINILDVKKTELTFDNL